MSEHPQADEHLTELLSPQLYIYSSLAQSVEHLTVNQGVAGSSPAGGANKKRDHQRWSLFLFSLSPAVHEHSTLRAQRARTGANFATVSQIRGEKLWL